MAEGSGNQDASTLSEQLVFWEGLERTGYAPLIGNDDFCTMTEDMFTKYRELVKNTLDQLSPAVKCTNNKRIVLFQRSTLNKFMEVPLTEESSKSIIKSCNDVPFKLYLAQVQKPTTMGFVKYTDDLFTILRKKLKEKESDSQLYTHNELKVLLSKPYIFCDNIQVEGRNVSLALISTEDSGFDEADPIWNGSHKPYIFSTGHNSSYCMIDNSEAFLHCIIQRKASLGSNSEPYSYHRETAIDAVNAVYINGFSISRKLLYYQSRHYLRELSIHTRNDSMPAAYSPLYTGFQTTGAGKSRSLMELHPFQLVLSMSGPNESGYPPRCTALYSLTVFFEENLFGKPVASMSKVANIVQNFFLRILYFILEDAKSNSDKDILFKSEHYPGKLKMKEQLLDGFKEYMEDTNITSKLCSMSVHDNRTDPIKMKNGLCITEEMLINELAELKVQRLDYLCNLYSELGDNRREILERQLNSIPSVLFVFDEAQSLLQTDLAKRFSWLNAAGEIVRSDSYLIIRRSLRLWGFGWKYAWGFALTSDAALLNVDPSLRGYQSYLDPKPVPPFIFDASYNVFAAEYFQIGSAGETVPNSIDYVRSWHRFLNVLSCGRPLFAATFHAKLGWSKDQVESLRREQFDKWPAVAVGAFEEIYDLITEKCVGRHTFGRKVDISNFDLCLCYPNLPYAIMCAAVNLRFVPARVGKESLIRNHMAWVTSADTIQHEYTIAYPAEGSFNSILSYVLASNAETLFQTEQIKEVFVSASSRKYMSSGQFGKVTVCIFLLFIIFDTPSCFADDKREKGSRPPLKKSPKVEERTYPSSPIPELAEKIFAPRYLSTFLEKFVPKDALAKFFGNCGIPDLKKSLVSFSYFQGSSEISNPVNLARAMFYRGSARTGSGTNLGGTHLFIPLALPSGEFGLVLVQVKHSQESLFMVDEVTLLSSTLSDVEKLCLSFITRGAYADGFCPVVRLLINFNSSPCKKGCFGEDSHGPYVVMETDGRHFNTTTPRSTSWRDDMLSEAIKKLNEGFEGKCSEVNADYVVPPCTMFSRSGEPYNATFVDGVNDCDKDVLPGSVQENRPVFDFTNVGKYPSFLSGIRR